MAKCVKIVRNKSRVCIGSMRRRVKIYDRVLTGDENNIDFNMDFSLLWIVWGNVQASTAGSIFFDATNIANTRTHIIDIRYKKGITAENWISIMRVDDSEVEDYFKILSVINLDDNYQFLRLNCLLRGDKLVDINKN